MTKEKLSKPVYSTTGYQSGFGRDQWKTVAGLTKAERDAVKAGRLVFINSRPAGGNHGTTLRVVLYRAGRFVPRVPSQKQIDIFDKGWE